MNKNTESICTFLKTHVGEKIAVIGISGGIDSATVAFLCVRALGAQHVIGLTLPSSTNAISEQANARDVIDALGITHIDIPIDPIVEAYKQNASFFDDKKTLGNLKARIRMSLLYAKANEVNGIVIGTGNKTEIMVGYTTKYGDAGVDLLPIGALYKSDVRVLAHELGVPAAVIAQKPTAGLWKGQYDEDELGMSYETLDGILFAIQTDGDTSSFSTANMEHVRALMKGAVHKQVPPPICAV